MPTIQIQAGPGRTVALRTFVETSIKGATLTDAIVIGDRIRSRVRPGDIVEISNEPIRGGVGVRFELQYSTGRVFVRVQTPRSK